MARKYAALPHEYWEEMADLTDEEFGRLARALLRYSMTGEESSLAGNERFFWRRVVNRERGLQKHYEEVSVKRSEAGKKGMASRWGAANDGKQNDGKDRGKVSGKEGDKVQSPPSGDGRRGRAAPGERLLRDMEALARLVEEGEGS